MRIYTYTYVTWDFNMAAYWSQIPVGGVTFTVRIRSDDTGVDFGVNEATVTAIPIAYSVYQFAEDYRLVNG